MNGTNQGPQAMTPDSPELSPLERIKSQSDYLRGRIAAELANAADHFSDESAQLLKLHGIYQQDDRDRRQYLGRPGQAGGRQGLQLHGADGHSRRTAQQRAIAGRVGPLRRVGQRHAPHHQPAEPATLRRGETEPGADAAPHQRGRADDAGGLRRRGAQRHVLPGAVLPRPGPRPDSGDGRRYLAEELRPQTPAYREIWLGDAPATAANGGQSRAALRQELPAAEVQSGHRPAGRQLRRSLRPGRGPDGHLREFSSGRLQRAGGRRHGHDAAAGEDLSRPGPAHGPDPPRAGRRRGPRHPHGLPRLRQPHAIAGRRG